MFDDTKEFLIFIFVVILVIPVGISFYLILNDLLLKYAN